MLRRLFFLVLMIAKGCAGLALASRQRISTRLMSTSPYHIDECATHSKLEKIVRKHVNSRQRWKTNHISSQHTLEALDQAVVFVESFHSRAGSGGEALPLVIDSGCGTGRSSAILAKNLPNLPVIGLDRSLDRLSKNKLYGRDASSSRNSSNSGAGEAAGNLLLLRCDVRGQDNAEELDP